MSLWVLSFDFFQREDGIRDKLVTGVQTCALPIWRPPQSNCPPDTVHHPDHGMVLEAQNIKGGISRVTPRQPKPPVHCLPPILSEISQTPISSCSKGSRGLSVFLRVLGIFTETLISPSLSLRQRPTRYAIRAGRNLPDKEFRYLRTVIVTAAVYRGLASLLRAEALTSPRNLPAPGRRQPLYVVLRLSRGLCFW